VLFSSGIEKALNDGPALRGLPLTSLESVITVDEEAASPIVREDPAEEVTRPSCDDVGSSPTDLVLRRECSPDACFVLLADIK